MVLRLSKTTFRSNVNSQKYREIETPTSSTSLSLSPISSASQCSPSSPPPIAAELCEFLHASLNNQYFENDFSTLTLSGKYDNLVFSFVLLFIETLIFIIMIYDRLRTTRIV